MSEYTSWNDPQLPAPVRFAPAVLERIRFLAIDGLLSLPRVGMGVGGLLLGGRDERGILVSEFRTLACRHAFGPSFRLTDEEAAAAAAEFSAGEADLKVVGCWVSKTRGGAQLAPDDRKLFDSLCPQTGQVAFLVEPSSVRPTRGAVFARAKDGGLKGGALVEIAAPMVENPPEAEEAPVEVAALPALTAAPPVLTAAPPVLKAAPPVLKAAPPVSKAAPTVSTTAPPVSTTAPPVRPEWKLAPKTELKPEPEPTPAAASAPRGQAPERPLFEALAAPAARKPALPLKWAVVAIVLAVLSVAAFATRDYWLPDRSLGLRSSDSNGHLIIEWNRKAVRGTSRALLTVNDGPDTRTLTVEGSILHSGSLDYERKTGKVTVRMRAGSADETTTFNVNP